MEGSIPQWVSREFRRSHFDLPDTSLSLSSIFPVCPSFKFLPGRVPPWRAPPKSGMRQERLFQNRILTLNRFILALRTLALWCWPSPLIHGWRSSMKPHSYRRQWSREVPNSSPAKPLTNAPSSLTGNVPPRRPDDADGNSRVRMSKPQITGRRRQHTAHLCIWRHGSHCGGGQQAHNAVPSRCNSAPDTAATRHGRIPDTALRW